MKMLFEKIKIDRIIAMKEKNEMAKNILSSIVSELEKIAKDLGSEIKDDQVIKMFKKYKDNAVEILKIETISEKDKTDYSKELDFLTKYIPEQISASELETIINEFVNTNSCKSKSGIGLVMKFLKEKYVGKYDGSLASEITKKICG